MNVEEIREYCLSKKGVSESLPFNDTALVFKVADRMFALLDLSGDNRGLSLKCDPGLALELREHYPEVTPAYHFNKKHWNGISLQGSVGDDKLREWIDHSYRLTAAKLPKKTQQELKIERNNE